MTIYLDNAATTRPCEAAISATFYTMAENYGNPSSLHRLGVQAEKVLTDARKAIASALVCAPETIYFTSGATEANNLAILGAAENYGKHRRKIVTTTVEHPSVSEAIRYLEGQGFEVVRIAPNHRGEILFEDIVAAVDKNTCLVSCMLVNNETGCILPIKRAFMAIKRDFPECVTHCDAVQGFLKIPFKASELYADVITISAHKIHGIKGIGAVMVKRGIRLAPRLLGGGQEKSLRPGTESVPLIAGFEAAVRAMQTDVVVALNNAEELNTYLRAGLSKLPYITTNSAEENSSPFILNFSIEGVKSEVMLHFLEDKDIFVSSGSACAKGAKSPILKEFGVPEKLLDGAIRISFSRLTTRDDVDALIIGITEGRQKLAQK